MLNIILDAPTVHVRGRINLCRHHQAYVRKLKEALRKAPELLDKDLNQLMQSVGTIGIWHPEVDQDVRNHGGGTRRPSCFRPCVTKVPC